MRLIRNHQLKSVDKELNMSKMIRTALGVIEGFVQNQVEKYLGIPFAEPPVGALRFKTAVAKQPWDGILQAKGFRKDPIQLNLIRDFSHYSEDCLYLNIWVPAERDEKLPVMVWIPGGAYANGGAGCDVPEGPAMYDGTRIAADAQAVVVSVSYRLNAFGFLNLHRYAEELDDHVGMKDIIEALRWVRQNIAAFGGDPENVTLFGESAGGGAISALLFCDEAKPYFDKAIIESNCWESFYDEEMEDMVCRKYLEFCGLTTEEAADIRKLSYEQLGEAHKKLDQYMFNDYFLRCSFAPVIDGVFLREFPTLSAMEQQDKAVLVGSNHDEGYFQVLAYQIGPDRTERLRDVLMQLVPEEDRKRLLSAYHFPAWEALGDLLTDVMYTFPKIRFAEHMSRAGKAPVYVYRYDYVTPFQKKYHMKACHVSELLALFPVVTSPFGDWGRGDEEQLEKIGRRMRRYFGAFARSGKPEAEGLTEWLPYDEKDRHTLVIAEEDRLEKDPEGEVRRLYEGIDRVEI